MNRTDLQNALTEIDDRFIIEAQESKTASIIKLNRRKICILVAAVVLALTLVACGAYTVYVESTEIEVLSLEDELIEFNSNYEVKNPMSVTGDEIKFVRLREIADEKGYTEEISTSFYVSEKTDDLCFEVGAFHTEKEAYAFFYTNADSLPQDSYIYLLLESENGGFYRCQKVTVDVDNSFEVVISAEEGWKIKSVYMDYLQENGTGYGGSEGWPFTGKPNRFMKMINEERSKLLERFYTN